MTAYRVSADIITDDGKATKVSFIVESGAPGWPWAVEQAHMHLSDVTVTSDVSVDQIWPGPAPDRWAELADWLGTTTADAAEDARAWGAQTGSARQVRTETLGQVRARMDEIERGL